MAPAETDPDSEAAAAAGEEAVDGSRMTLGEHLSELRVRVMRAALVFIVAVVALYHYREAAQRFIRIPHTQAVEWLNQDLAANWVKDLKADPALNWAEYFRIPEVEIPRAAQLAEAEEFDIEGFVEEHALHLHLTAEYDFPQELQTLKAGGPFISKLKVAVLLAVFIAAPMFLWEMWMFIAAGLYRAEKKVVYSCFPVMMGLFASGVAFGFYFMVPYAIYFLQADGLGTDGFSREMVLSYYLEFLRGLALAMGLVFQLPVIQVALSRMGLVEPKLYAKYRGHMAIAALVVAAVITPPDPVTQLLLAGPAIVLWEVGIWVSRLFWTEPPEAIPEEEFVETGVSV